ncbi:uncharacterized protein LOC111369015 [Olea europaea var. sylvestris]|uniref:uncharacterized protein LOC111369015 n=1 Tax=Olea europaea var. sylvestris TaxID=158386 RepID=UPI000C1D71BA|nr:uncharacterized protein LOC111369015 [Olea europaea var. sylvestris]
MDFGKPRYIAFKCTELSKKKYDDQDMNKKGNARVFALNQHKAKHDPNVIACILLLSDIPAYVVFDFGTTNSFISASFVTRINIACVKTNIVLEFSIHSERNLSTNQMTKAIKLEMAKRNCRGLMPFRDGRFRFFLGMDWLGHNHVTIRCYEKEVLFHRPGEEEFHFFGTQFKSLSCLVSAV